MHENEISFHNLESPAPEATISAGWQRLRGWVVPKPGFHLVDIRARIGSRIFPGVYGFPRADLAAYFEPKRPWLPAEYTVDFEAAPGLAAILIEALSLTGEWHAVQSVSCRAEGPPALRPKFDAFGVKEFAWALQQGLKQPSATSKDAAAVARAVPFPHALRPNHAPFHGFMDVPAAIVPALYGRVHVLGWLFHETVPIKRAYVSTDLLIFHRLEIGGEFPGVNERFPHLPLARGCRLTGFADVSSPLPGPICARIYAELADGSMHLCLANLCHVITTEEIKAAYQPFVFRQFFRTWSSVRQTLRERGVVLEAKAGSWAQLWETFFEYRREAPRIRPARSKSDLVASRLAGAPLRRLCSSLTI